MRSRLLFVHGRQTLSCPLRGSRREKPVVAQRVRSIFAAAIPRRLRTFPRRKGSRHAQLRFVVRGCCRASRRLGKGQASSFLYGCYVSRLFSHIVRPNSLRAEECHPSSRAVMVHGWGKR